MRDVSLASVTAVLSLFVTAIVGISGPYTAYDLNRRGSIPEKQIQVEFTGPVDLLSPARNFSDSGVDLSVDVKLNGETLKNLYYELVRFSNIGQAPVLPTDIYQDVSLRVSPPWRIVAVSSWNIGKAIPLIWNRISDTEYQAKPTLLNPEDAALTSVYITNAQDTKDDLIHKILPNEISVQGRIVNMRDFTTPTVRALTQVKLPFSLSISVYGWGIPLSILLIFLSEYSYLYFFNRLNLLSPWRPISILLVLGSCILSISAAEASSTYIFGRLVLDRFVDYDVSNSLNAPWIFGNLVVLFSLAFYSARGIRRP